MSMAQQPHVAPVQQNKVITLQSLQPLYDLCDVFIFDLWGVIHNGVQIFEGARRVLLDLTHLKKPVYFLSNAPRRVDLAQKQLRDRGVEDHLYAGILTSGQVCLEHLRDRPDPFYQALGRHIYPIGPKRDLSLIEGLDYTCTDVHQADFILNTGLSHVDNPLEVYLPYLHTGIKRGLPMICANPDHTALSGDVDNPKHVLCAGYLAHEYTQMGGIVRYHGKPDARMFQSLYTRYHIPQNARALMIGDSFRTDMCGVKNAQQQGLTLESVFIASGIHRIQHNEDLYACIQDYDVSPSYMLEYLC